MSQKTGAVPDYRALIKKSLLKIEQLQAKLDAYEQARREPIAIIGMACRFPGGADDPTSFWALLREGVDAITEVPADRWDVDALYDAAPEASGKMSTRFGGFLKQVDLFDAQFFNISPREAISMDPQQRLLLEVSWEALEGANLLPERLYGHRVGVFVGISSFDYAMRLGNPVNRSRLDAYAGTGGALSAAAGRLSYFYGFTGPSMAVDSACSSSLLSVHLACQSLRQNESDMALAGGVNVLLAPEMTINFSKARMMAPDGRCKTFDASADGYVRGEGCGMIVLKRLSDALAAGDDILAVIRGSAANQDGSSGGFTVPSGPSQVKVIQDALENAGVKPAEVSYIEAHGTGTSLGDPIEVGALAEVFGQGRTEPLMIGSVKTNIGHLEGAAGIAGLIKTVLALTKEELPPHLHFNSPSPLISWDNIPIKVVAKRTAWLGERVAGVSSFGFSGTNAHLVLSSPPPHEPFRLSSQPPYRLTLSAKSQEALHEMARRYLKYFSALQEEALADSCFRVNTTRTQFEFSLNIDASSKAEMCEKLRSSIPKEYALKGDDSAEDLMNLPTYPFQRRRYWFETGMDAPQAALSHPLLGQSVELAMRKRLFFCEIPSYLSEHRINQEAILPASAFFEMALAAAFTEWGGMMGLQSVRIQEQMLLSSKNHQDLQLFLSQDKQSFEIYSQYPKSTLSKSSLSAATSDWRLHASGLVNRKAEAVDLPTVPPLSLLQAEINQERSVSAFYQQLDEFGFNYGLPFQVIRQLWQTPHDAPLKGQALGRLQLPEDYAQKAGDQHSAYLLHPILLDGCFQLIGAALPGAPATYLPVQLERLTLLADNLGFQESLWGYAKIRDEGAENRLARITADGSLFAHDGTLVAQIEGLILQRADQLHQRSLESGSLPTKNMYEIKWNPSAPPTEPSAFSPTEGKWLIFADSGGIWEEVAALLAAQGQHCLIVAAGDAYQRVTSDEGVDHVPLGSYYLNPSNASDFHRLFDEALADRALSGVLYLWGLEEAQRALRGALYLVQALEAAHLPAHWLWLVTRAAQPVSSLDEVSFELAPLWGLGRVIAQELPKLQTISLDLPPEQDHTEAQTIVTELLSPDSERQIAYRNKQRHVARLVADAHFAAATPAATPTTPVQVRLTEAGILDKLHLVPQRRRPPAAGEVEIEVYATGLNFRDVLNALGMLSAYTAQLGITNPSDVPFGGECTGKIVTIGEGVSNFKVGDEVIAAMAIGSLASFVTVNAQFVVHKPKNLSFIEAATIPTTFLTAYYGLHELAMMQAGERVLIHAAAGGVGQAAIQLAQAAGADLFVTASPPKWEHLQAMGIEPSHIMNSRTLDFASEVRTLTNGQGVDIVLNSLSGNFIDKSAEVVAQNGRFIELGKIGIWDQQKQQKERPDLSYYPFVLTEVAQDEPEVITKMLNALINQFNAGTLSPLPYKTFPLHDVVNAFRYMAQAKHIGKIVITHTTRAKLGQADSSPHFGSYEIRTDSSYLITGGLGALGLQVADWLIKQGAKHLVLTGRRGAATEAAQEALQQLEAAGAKVLVLKANVAKEEEVVQLLATIKEKMPPLGAIIHAAGILDDGVLRQQNWSRFERVMAPKIAGARNLHTLSPKTLQIYFSSIASILGSPGQSNYAAANAYMDALAHHRQRMGLPTISINWGAWAEIGMAAQTGADKRLAALGINPITPEDGLQLLTTLLTAVTLPPQLIVLPIDFERFKQHKLSPFFSELLAQEVAADERAKEKPRSPISNLLTEITKADPSERLTLLQDYLQNEIAQVLALPKNDLNIQQPLINLGLDSLMAVELKNRITEKLELDIPIEKFIEANSLIELANTLYQQLTLADILLTEPETEAFDEEEMEEFTL